MTKLTLAEVEELRTAFAATALDEFAPTKVRLRSTQIRLLIDEVLLGREEQAENGGPA
jgi:hypothetical protein